VLACFNPALLRGQPYTREVDGIPVRASGTQVILPFAGGINNPNHQFVDIDGDGDYDLFILDNDLAVDFYRNEGTITAPNFKLRTGAIPLPPFSRWFLFVDYDGDSLTDLCCDDSTFSGVRVYKNTGSVQNPLYTLLIPTLHDVNGIDVFAGQSSIPAFVDIDGDADLDFFSGNFDGTVNLYLNVGSNTTPRYAFTSAHWQNILILGDSCYTYSTAHALHGASAFRFADVDGDNDLDFFIGDLYSSRAFFMNNIGTPTAAIIACNGYYPQNTPLQTEGLNQCSFVDIDHDGDLDMFVAVLAVQTQANSFYFFENTGSPTAPYFQLITRSYFSMIDVGMNAHPAFVDIDADGDQDFFIGNLNGQLTFYRNTGTSNSPEFTLIDSLYQNIIGGFSFFPVFVDIDNDGDKDLFLGKIYSHIAFYRNVGTPQSALFIAAPSPVDSINVSVSAVPAFADIDNDNDLDLFIGDLNGRISFYRNNGSSTLFQPALVSSFYQSIQAGQEAAPTFVDEDSDGDYDLFIGTYEGRIEFYRNTGTSTNAQFIRITNAYGPTARTQEASPAFADIDGDGDKDLLVGGSKGGVYFYRNLRVTNEVGDGDVAPGFHLLQNYPNPFNPSTHIDYQLTTASFVNLKVYDILGREVMTLVNRVEPQGTHSVTFDGTSVAGGVYFYSLTAADYHSVRKFVLFK